MPLLLTLLEQTLSDYSHLKYFWKFISGPFCLKTDLGYNSQGNICGVNNLPIDLYVSKDTTDFFLRLTSLQ